METQWNFLVEPCKMDNTCEQCLFKSQNNINSLKWFYLEEKTQKMSIIRLVNVFEINSKWATAIPKRLYSDPCEIHFLHSTLICWRLKISDDHTLWSVKLFFPSTRHKCTNVFGCNFVKPWFVNIDTTDDEQGRLDAWMRINSKIIYAIWEDHFFTCDFFGCNFMLNNV